MDGAQGRQWADRAARVLAGGAATLSKNVDRFGVGAVPTCLVRGDGATVWDADGRSYLDTVAALGPVLLGYNDPAVNAAVHAQVNAGVSFSLLHPLEIEVAEAIARLLPSVERVRFAKNGADVTQAAVRLARYLTNRAHVFVCGYHGMHDFYIATTANAGGVLDGVGLFSHQLPWGDRRAWESALQIYGSELAAIMVEIPPWPWQDPEAFAQGAAFAHFLQDEAARLGALFVLDEVVTGCRYHLGGAQTLYGLQPDLTCLGKGLANGYPLAALAGRATTMAPLTDGQVFLSTTNGGECVSLAAAKATLTVLTETAALTRLHQAGEALGEGLCRLVRRHALPLTVLGHPSRLVLRWQEVPGVAHAAELKTLWIAEHAKRGILYGGPTLPMACWGPPQIDHLLDAATDVTALMSAAIWRGSVRQCLPGEPLRDVFGQRYAPAMGEAAPRVES